MGFLTLLEVASMPVLQMLIIGGLGAYMATGYCNILTSDARKSLNKIVFAVFTPSLMFASLAKTVTLQDMISWWFMPINIGLTFLIGGILGWIVVKVLRPPPHLEGLVVAGCSTGNMGNLLFIIVPAICNEKGSPFSSDPIACSAAGFSYAAFSAAVGGFYIWTYTYNLIRTSSIKYKELQAQAREEASKVPNMALDANAETLFLKRGGIQNADENVQSTKPHKDMENQDVSPNNDNQMPYWRKLAGSLNQVLKEIMSPPTIMSILGMIFGAVSWLKNLLIGDGAPLRVMQDSIKLLGDGTVPCMTLILGGNLTQGLYSSSIKPWVIGGVIIARYGILPLTGIGVVKAASSLGFLPSDPLFSFVLMAQYTMPPAMNIGTITQLFDVAQEECSVLFLWTYMAAAVLFDVAQEEYSVLFLWTYMAAAVVLTIWSMIFMWILF